MKKLKKTTKQHRKLHLLYHTIGCIEQQIIFGKLWSIEVYSILLLIWLDPMLSGKTEDALAGLDFKNSAWVRVQTILFTAVPEYCQAFAVNTVTDNIDQLAVISFLSCRTSIVINTLFLIIEPPEKPGLRSLMYIVSCYTPTSLSC